MLDTALDHAIPFVPEAMVVYLSVYLFLVMPVLQIRSLVLLTRAVWAFAALNLFGILVFTYFPVRVARPEVVVHSLFTWGVAFNYAYDPPYNSFPSLHVANAFFAAWLSRRVDRPVGNVALAVASAIALSTLLVKQHWIADVLTGIPLGFLAYRWAVKTGVPEGASPGELIFPRKYIGMLAGAYGVVFLVLVLGYYAGWRPF